MGSTLGADDFAIPLLTTLAALTLLPTTFADLSPRLGFEPVGEGPCCLVNVQPPKCLRYLLNGILLLCDFKLLGEIINVDSDS